MNKEDIKIAGEDAPLKVGTGNELEINPLPRARKLRGRHKKRTLVPKEKRTTLAKNSLFAGMTNMNCCGDCKPTGCVISGRPYCAHPYKGGLQSSELTNIAAITRLNDAKVFLKRQAMG